MTTKIRKGTAEKYTASYICLVKEIKKGTLEYKKFIENNHLPELFLKACCNLNFISNLGRGKYAVKYESSSEMVGKLISDEICKIERTRKMIFSNTNHE